MRCKHGTKPGSPQIVYSYILVMEKGVETGPAHVAILDKGQRSVKGLNFGSEGVVTVDLTVTLQKPTKGESTGMAAALASGDKDALIREAIEELSADD